jgi:RHS repeat-associated protein
MVSRAFGRAFGLKMAGISDQALPVVPNNYLYNGKELQQNEFSDGSGLEDYDYGFRGYDPQLGRFTEQDPLTDEFATVSPYQYGLNDPVANIDEDGLAVLPVLTVTAQAVNRMSAFSSFTLSILGEASLANRIIDFANIGTHLFQIGGVLNAWNVTRGIGENPRQSFYQQFGNAAINAAISAGATNKYKGLYLVAERRVENGFNLNPPGNNPMNIKGEGDLATISYPTHEDYDNKSILVRGKFAKFSSIEKGFEGYLKLLKRNFPNAYNALRDNSKTIMDFISGLQKGRIGSFASDPKYPQKIKSTFNSVVSDYKEEINEKINSNNEMIHELKASSSSTFYTNRVINLNERWINMKIGALQKLNTQLNKDIKLLTKIK